MQIKINNKILSLLLISISISSLFLGYYFNENSAGAGSYEGDLGSIWKNLQIFLKNDLLESINHPDYFDSRTPIAYILHEIFNPFVKNIESYRKSVFIISLSLPILFYFSLKKKFKTEDNLLLLLISSLVCLSPYFRTSSYWGLEENFGLIFLLLTFLSLNNFLSKDNEAGYKVHLILFMVAFTSSCCLYFDQKLAIIPIISLVQVLKSKNFLQFKLLLIFYYFLFSLPYIYLITIWGSILPPIASASRMLGSKIFLDHIGFASTMIAFYLLPLLFFKEKNFSGLIKDFFSKKINFYLIISFLIYLSCLILFFDIGSHSIIAKGFINKIAFILFEDSYLKSLFLYFSFFVSWIVILIYIEDKLIDILTIIYLFLLSLILWPLHQEYFDPLILLMAFTFFNNKLILNLKNSVILYSYLFLLLITANVYYAKILN